MLVHLHCGAVNTQSSGLFDEKNIHIIRDDLAKNLEEAFKQWQGLSWSVDVNFVFPSSFEMIASLIIQNFFSLVSMFIREWPNVTKENKVMVDANLIGDYP